MMAPTVRLAAASEVVRSSPEHVAHLLQSVGVHVPLLGSLLKEPAGPGDRSGATEGLEVHEDVCGVHVW